MNISFLPKRFAMLLIAVTASFASFAGSQSSEGVEMIAENEIVCPGASTNIDVGATFGQPPYTFLWNTGDTDPSITLSYLYSDEVVSVTVTDDLGEQRTIADTIIVSSSTIHVPSFSVGKIGDSVHVVVTVEGNDAPYKAAPLSVKQRIVKINDTAFEFICKLAEYNETQEIEITGNSGCPENNWIHTLAEINDFFGIVPDGDPSFCLPSSYKILRLFDETGNGNQFDWYVNGKLTASTTSQNEAFIHEYSEESEVVVKAYFAEKYVGKALIGSDTITITQSKSTISFGVNTDKPLYSGLPNTNLLVSASTTGTISDEVYSWFPEKLLQKQSTNTALYEPITNPQECFVVVSDVDGTCYAASPFTVVPNLTDELTIYSEATYCSGQELSLSVGFLPSNVDYSLYDIEWVEASLGHIGNGVYLSYAFTGDVEITCKVYYNNILLGSKSVVVTELASPEVSIDPYYYFESTNDIIITPTITGGVAPFNAYWSSPSAKQNDNISALIAYSETAKSYTVKVYDNIGCSAKTQTIVMPTDAQVSALLQASNTGALCPGSEITLTATGYGGADGPHVQDAYSFKWYTDSVSFSSPILGTEPTLTVRPTNNTTFFVVVSMGYESDTVSIQTTILDPYDSQLQITEPVCPGSSTGEIVFPKDYNRQQVLFQERTYLGSDMLEFSELSAGIYPITVYGQSGVEGEITYCSVDTIIMQDHGIALSIQDSILSPSTDGMNDGAVRFFATKDEKNITELYYNLVDSAQTKASSPFDIESLVSGSYLLTVEEANGCQTEYEFSVPEKVELGLESDVYDPLCAGESTGSITLYVYNYDKTLPIKYAWTNGESTASISGLAVGTYTVTISGFTESGQRDTLIESFKISDPDPYKYSIQTSPELYCSPKTGMALISAQTNDNITFEWLPSGLYGQEIDTLQAGNYTVLAKNSSGCVDTLAVEIGKTEPIAVDLGNDTIICEGDSILLVAGPRDAGYGYYWSNESKSEKTYAKSYGSYSVTVSDQNECEVSDTIYISGVFDDPINICDLSVSESGDVAISLNESDLQRLENFTIYKNGEVLKTLEASAGKTYIDTDNISSKQSETYRIDGTTACGDQTMPGNDLSSIFLQTEIDAKGNHVLSWNAAYFTEYSKILAGPSLSQLSVLKDSIVNDGQEQMQYTITDAQKKVYYQIQMTASDVPRSCFKNYTSNIAYVSVYPKVDFTIAQTTVAIGERSLFSAIVDEGTDISWRCPGGRIIQTSDQTFRQSYTKPGTYSVTLLAQKNGYIDSIVKKDAITVIGINAPETPVCPGSKVTLSVPSNADYTYEWSTGAETARISLAPFADTTISVKVYVPDRIGYLSDEVTISVRPQVDFAVESTPCSGDSLLVEFDGFATYSWNKSPFTDKNQYYITEPNTTYFISAKDSAGCISSDELSIGDFAPSPKYIFGADTTLCAGETLQIDIQETYSAQWSTGSTDQSMVISESGDYAVTMTLDHCKTIDSISVTVAQTESPAYAAVTVAADGSAAVMWPAESQFVQYEVLRETDVLDEYEQVSTVLATDSSYSGDYAVDLRNNQKLYQVKAYDTCGNASTITTNSIHLQASVSLQNEIDLTWSKFEGFAVPTYYIYRGTDASAMTLLTTITGTLYNFKDQHPVESAIYVVAVDAQDATIPQAFLLGEWQAGKFVSNIATSGYTSPLPSVDFVASRTHIGIGSPVTLTSLTQKADEIKWDISNASVSSLVDSIIIVSFADEGTYSVTLSAKNKEGSDTLTKTDYIQVGNVPVDSIIFKDTTIQLAVGQIASLELLAFPYDTDLGTVEFLSSNDSIVMASNGIAYAAREGSATVTATEIESGSSATIKIVVQGSIGATDIVLPYTLWIEAGSSRELEPVFVPFSLGSLPIEWNVSDTALASIDENGVLFAKKAGNVNVFGYEPTSSLPVSVPVTITDHPDTANVVDIPATMEISAGYAYNVPTTISPKNTTGATISWSVSDLEMLSVTKDGVLKPTKAGTGYVVAHIGEYTDTCFLTILPSKKPVLSFADTVTLLSGTQKEFFVLNYIEDDNTPPVDIEWELIVTEQLTSKIENSIVYLTANESFTGNLQFALVAKDVDMLTDTAYVIANVKGLDTIAPTITLPNLAILKGTESKTIALPEYIADNITPDTFLSSSVSESIAGAEISAELNILEITILSDAELFSETFTLSVKDENNNIASKNIVLTLSDEPNKAPELARIPNQQQTNREQFATINLRKYVSDDYTLPADILWDVTGTRRLAAKIKNGRLFVYAKDASWTGSERLTIIATDEYGLSTSKSVWYSQIAASPEAWQGSPEVSFQASALYTVPGRLVELYGSVNGSKEMFWNMPGADPESSRDLIPNISYSKQGVYDISLSAQNEYGSSELLKEKYITVVGVNERNATICAGESQDLTIDAPGFTTFAWSTGEETQNITVSPEVTTSYIVTISKGITSVLDTVTVTVSNGLDLGEDQSLCTGDSVVLSAEGYDQYFWNGSETAGSNQLTVREAGTYTLLVHDGSGCSFRDTFLITEVLPKPSFSLGNDTTFCYNSWVKVGTTTPGTYMWSTGAESDSIAIDTTGTYTLSVTSENGCVSTSSIKTTAKLPYNQSIGIVTIDSETGKNLIAWERPKDKDIVSYKVFRESDVAGVFDVIKEQAFSELSIVVDEQSEPNARQYTYGISTIDGCGNESPMSATHTPIFLSQKINNDGNVILSWEPYAISDGSSIVFKSYQIYRGTIGNSLSEYKKVSASVKTYTDIEVAGAKTLYYRVAIILDNQVNPAVLKSDSGPFSQSMSNLAEAVVEDGNSSGTSIAESFATTVDVFPAPVANTVNILVQSATDYSVSIIASSGADVYSQSYPGAGTELHTIDLSSLPSAVYAIVVRSGNKTYTRQITKIDQ